MSDKELLLAISDMMDKKLDARLKPLENNLKDIQNDIHNIKLFQENVIIPRLKTIESCYTDTYNRYKDSSDKMQAAFDDIDLLKKVVTEHSIKLQNFN